MIVQFLRKVKHLAFFRDCENFSFFVSSIFNYVFYSCFRNPLIELASPQIDYNVH